MTENITTEEQPVSKIEFAEHLAVALVKIEPFRKCVIKAFKNKKSKIFSGKVADLISNFVEHYEIAKTSQSEKPSENSESQQSNLLVIPEPDSGKEPQLPSSYIVVPTVCQIQLTPDNIESLCTQCPSEECQDVPEDTIVSQANMAEIIREGRNFKTFLKCFRNVQTNHPDCFTQLPEETAAIFNKVKEQGYNFRFEKSTAKLVQDAKEKQNSLKL